VTAETEAASIACICDKAGCEKPMTGYDAWGQWCDEHSGEGAVPGAPVRPEDALDEGWTK
jgi:hypothetical protein